MQLLGRSIDLNSLLSQRLGSNMLKAIDTAIHVFESRNLCGVVVSTRTHSVAMPNSVARAKSVTMATTVTIATVYCTFTEKNYVKL